MRLTKRVIDGARYRGQDGSRDFRWDDEVRGFGLRIYPSGRKAFVLSYRHDGRKRLIALGSFGELTVEQARNLARTSIVAVKVEHTDPLAEREKALLGESVADLGKAYMDRYARIRKSTWRDDEQRLNKYVIPKWGALKATALTRLDVAALHRRIGAKPPHGAGHPYAANRLLELIAKMYELGKLWGVVDENHTNPARRIEAFPEEKRDRWVTAEEMPRLFSAVRKDPNIYAQAAIYLYLLTGARKTELLKARWEDISWQAKLAELRLPETKNGRAHHIPLCDPAVQLLKRLPRQKGNPHLFPGALGGQHLINIDKPWRRIRADAGIPDVRLHDLRRTVGSWLAQDNHSLHVIAGILNHKTVSTTQVYARLRDASLRNALNRHGRRLTRTTGALKLMALKPGTSP